MSTVTDQKPALAEALAQLVSRRYPGARIVAMRPLATDESPTGETAKATGYGAPVRIDLELSERQPLTLVLRWATPNEFGHDRRSDRAAEMLLDFDTFGLIPGHVRAIDVGARDRDGHLVSLKDAGEFYLLTGYAPGTLYAEDLRRIAREGTLRPGDLERTEALARYLVELHHTKIHHPAGYARAIRDLVGHGEGIFGMIDGYERSTPAAGPERLQEIERRCLDWRWRLRTRSNRLARTHGDFHPFNIVFQGGQRFALVDASRGCEGDPADDVCALAINYLFFALERPAAWSGAFRALWTRFLQTYLGASGDDELLSVVQPFLAWRGLVVASPVFYPSLSAGDRDRLLAFVERTLATERFSLEAADQVFV